MSKDQVFSEPRSQIVDFAFDEAVASVFPDMIRRSVPGYELVVPMTGQLAARALRDCASSRAYDLGCSLGATTLAILKSLEALEVMKPGLEIIAVDNSAAMLEQAKTVVTDSQVTFVEADVRAMALENAGAVTMNWVLQFLPPDDRAEVLSTIRAGLSEGGLLLLSEKVRSSDPEVEAFNDAAHLDFKRANGYSELEISQKRSALEQVMITDTIEAHRARLEQAGFSRVQVWYQCLNWASFVAS